MTPYMIAGIVGAGALAYLLYYETHKTSVPAQAGAFSMGGSGWGPRGQLGATRVLHFTGAQTSTTLIWYQGQRRMTSVVTMAMIAGVCGQAPTNRSTVLNADGTGGLMIMCPGDTLTIYLPQGGSWGPGAVASSAGYIALNQIPLW